MRISSPKASAFTNVLMASNDILLLIRWAFHFSPTALKPIYPMIRAWSKCWVTTRDYFRAKPVNIPKITIELTNGYHPQTITAALQKLYPQIMTKIRFELAPKPTKAEKAAQGKTGFVVVATRWVIERSNAWMERCKSLVKNFERTLSHATAKLNLCFIRLMLKRLANE